MISTFLQMRAENWRGTFSRAIACICVSLWMAGSVSTLYGSLTPQWTTPHCPQSHSNAAHHTHGSCAWHCDGIDNPSSSGRSWGPSITPTGFLFGSLSDTSDATTLNGGVTSRGPPQSIFLDSSKPCYAGRIPTIKLEELNLEGNTHESA